MTATDGNQPTEREIQRWAERWFAANRPGEVRPFCMTAVLTAFLKYLDERRETINPRDLT